MVLPRTSPCDNFDCQNGAQCIIRINEPICQCLPGYQGEKCEKLVSVNFVNKESYLQIPSAKVRPQTNITLQVSCAPEARADFTLSHIQLQITDIRGSSGVLLFRKETVTVPITQRQKTLSA